MTSKTIQNGLVGVVLAKILMTKDMMQRTYLKESRKIGLSANSKVLLTTFFRTFNNQSRNIVQAPKI